MGTTNTMADFELLGENPSLKAVNEKEGLTNLCS